MTFRKRFAQIPWRLLPLVAGAGVLLGLTSLALSAEQRTNSSPLPSFCLPPPLAGASVSDAIALLPVIPPAPSPVPSSLPPGVSASFVGPFPGEAPPSPDAFKSLYGYQGPYYNTTDLDGQVVVLDSSLYNWPISTWKVTGLVRNQTRCPVQVGYVSARLLGSQGQLIGTVTATIPITNLRPGEPGPFVIESQIAGGEVKAVEWRVDATPTPPPLRQFQFLIGKSSETTDGTAYTLDALITNDSSTTANGTHVVVAWLDDSNRVLYVKSATMSPYLNPADSVDLRAHDMAGVLYSTNDPAVASVLGDATNFAIWGTAR